MTALPSPAAVPLALLTSALLLSVVGCSADGRGGAPAVPTVTVTAAPGAPASSPSTPGGSATELPVSSSPRPSAALGGACDLGDLRVRYADDPGGAGAGNVAGTFTFTNASSGSCTLRGFPGVSFVGGGDGTQVGRAATRTADESTTTTLRPGARATAPLRRSRPGAYGDACRETPVDGFRVFPPGSTESTYVAFPTTGCTAGSAPLLQVGPVR